MGEQAPERADAAAEPESSAAEPGPDARKKARLVFGDPLERPSRDDTDRGWGGRPGAEEGGRERGLDWYLSQRPPHHGD
ncbi:MULTISPECIES: hypothetical protein [Kitasatospora]|uniref:Uncharacterized protein n=2 Tax=Kitasatospora TaxID=2063 RepID=A0ABT1IQ26_9ACTN|nr:hypothetical protein [Kitasatospora paracochleata]MCP2307219.1 hypothetical protein [Kitasatospora paracochleata]